MALNFCIDLRILMIKGGVKRVQREVEYFVRSVRMMNTAWGPSTTYYLRYTLFELELPTLNEIAQNMT